MLYACPNGPRPGGALGAFLSASDNLFLLRFAVASCFLVNLRADKSTHLKRIEPQIVQVLHKLLRQHEHDTRILLHLLPLRFHLEYLQCLKRNHL